MSKRKQSKVAKAIARVAARRQRESMSRYVLANRRRLV